MIKANKPPFSEDDIWCSNPPGASDLVRPNDAKISQGFRYAEIPKHSTFNWAGNLVSQYIAHINKYGIAEWDDQTTYQEGALVLRGDSTSGREIYIALTTNTGEDPLGGTNPNWRQFFDTLNEFQDVNISNPAVGDVIQQVIYEQDDDTVPFYRMWENIPGVNILKIKELDDVAGSDVDGSVLFKMDTINNDEMWVVVPSNYLINWVAFHQFKDVENDPTQWNRGDVLTFGGGAWGGQVDEGYVEWNDILLRPAYLPPVETSPTQIGGFRADFSFDTNGEPVLDLFSTRIPVPFPPINISATYNLSDKVTITWDPATSGYAASKYIIFRDDEYLGETIDETITTFDDTTAELNKIYRYYVIARNLEGNSDPSVSTTGARTDIIAGVGDLSASNNTSSTVITLNWTSQEGAIGYNLYKKKQGETNYSYAAGGIFPPFYYYELPDSDVEFFIRAVNPNGVEGNDSNIAFGQTKARPGNKIYQANGTFSIPNGIDYLLIEMEAGGGSGAIGTEDDYHSGGGYAGEFRKEIIDVSNIGSISVNVGAGGVISDYTLPQDGVDGENTELILNYHGGDSKTILAHGGRGGDYRSENYAGNGLDRPSTVTGLNYKDGLHSSMPYMISCYGGQASEFGNGGSRSGQITGPGAGGAAISDKQKWYDKPEFNSGGNGIVVFTWGSINPVAVTNPDQDPEASEIKMVESDLNRGFTIGTNLAERFPNNDIRDFQALKDKR